MSLTIGVSALAMRGSPGELDSGVARYCAGLIEAWIEDDGGHRFLVWVSSGFAVPAAWRRNPNVTFHVASGPWARYKTLWELLAAGRAAAGCDVWLSTAHAVPLAARVPVVLSVQDLFTFSHPRFYTWKHRLVIGWAMRRALRRADGLVAISRHTRHELASRFGIDEGSVTVTPLGLGRQVTPLAAGSVDDDALRALGVGGTEYLLTLSTVEPRKNLERLFEAFALLAERPEWRALRLVVAGRRGWKTAPIYRRPAELGLGDRVDFVGYVPDDELPRLFARCRAFVLPSIIEGFGLPLLEAMAFGVPVAASRSGSLVEVGGDVPFYFDPLDSADMAAAIERALAAPASRPDRAQAGRERAAAFSWRRTAEGTLAALVAAAAGPSRRVATGRGAR